MPPSIRIKVESVTHPTEDAEKVKVALLNIFPTLSFKATNQGERVFLGAEGNSIGDLSQIRDLIRKERTPDSARRIFRSSTAYGKTIVYLNKQVAMVNQVSFCAPEGESPLGPITLTLESDNLDEVIDWLAPRTQKYQRGT
jgi:predicted RNA binding protein with dsRBD fold (UPF0201 family)